jgi:hypothetical protein
MMLLDPLLDRVEPFQELAVSESEKAAVLYSHVIDYLMGFDHESVRNLAHTLWDIIFKNVVIISPTEKRNLSLEVSCYEGLYEATLRLPEDWYDSFMADPVYHIGGVLYTGSQAVDYWNSRYLYDHEASTLRAQAYESELLYRVKLDTPEYILSTYQQNLVHHFPKGLCSPSAQDLIYVSTPIEVIEA